MISYECSDGSIEVAPPPLGFYGSNLGPPAGDHLRQRRDAQKPFFRSHDLDRVIVPHNPDGVMTHSLHQLGLVDSINELEDGDWQNVLRLLRGQREEYLQKECFKPMQREDLVSYVKIFDHELDKENHLQPSSEQVAEWKKWDTGSLHKAWQSDEAIIDGEKCQREWRGVSINLSIMIGSVLAEIEKVESASKSFPE